MTARQALTRLGGNPDGKTLMQVLAEIRELTTPPQLTFNPTAPTETRS